MIHWKIFFFNKKGYLENKPKLSFCILDTTPYFLYALFYKEHTKSTYFIRPCDEIGRHASFRHLCREVCRFESDRGHLGVEAR